MQVEGKAQRKRCLEFITDADGLDGYDASCNKKKKKIGTRHFPEICFPDLQNVDRNMILAR